MSSQIATGQLRLTQIEADLEQEKSTLAQQVSQLKSRLTKQEAVTGYSIKSPIDGLVTASICRAGEILDPERTLMVVLPESSRLIGEVSLPTSAIAFVHEGYQVRIRYDALPVTEFGSFPGVVDEISATTSDGLPNSKSGQEYQVWISIQNDIIDASPGPVKLQSGMLFTADVVLEDRRIVDWLFGSEYR